MLRAVASHLRLVVSSLRVSMQHLSCPRFCGAAQWRRGRRSSFGPARSRSSFRDFILAAQAELCAQFEGLDGAATFCTDAWERDGGGKTGFGITRVLTDGAAFEKAAVNTSVVSGVLTPARAAAMSSRGRRCVDAAGGQAYAAAALSLVVHGSNPHVPTLRADVRSFTVEGETWFGGGVDLTPSYLHVADVRAFHRSLRALCDAHQRPGTPAGALYEQYRVRNYIFFLIFQITVLVRR